MKWYYRDGEKTVGPLADTSIRELKACGVISDNTSVREDNSDIWKRFDKVFGSSGQSDEPEEEEHSANVIKFHCPHCEQKIAADAGQENQSVQCPSCGADFVVPSSSLDEEVSPTPTTRMIEDATAGEDPISSPPPSPNISAGQSLKSYLVIRKGEQVGPYSVAEITGKITAGELSPSDMCWAEGMSGWEPLHNTLSLGTGTPPPPPPAVRQSVPTGPGSSGLGDALKNLFGSLAALCGTLFKSAATSETARHAKQKVAEKLNKGAVEIQKKAANLIHHSGERIADPLKSNISGTLDASSPPPPPPPRPNATLTGPPENGKSNFYATSGEPNRRPVKWKAALVFICLVAAFMCFGSYLLLEEDPEAALMYAWIGLPITILGVTFLSILHFKCWNTLPTEFRATTPGKAVGFMFIPFFNFYWGFITWPKLSEGLAGWQRSAGINPTSTKGLGITFAILFIFHWIFVLITVPALAIMIDIALLVIFILYYLKLVRGLNQMLGASAAASAPTPAAFWSFKRTAISIGVALPLYWIILGVTYDPDEPPTSYGYEESLPSWYTNYQGNQNQSSGSRTCDNCRGTGTSKYGLKSGCMRCMGKGTKRTGSGHYIVCSNCNGEGEVPPTCGRCSGTGVIR